MLDAHRDVFTTLFQRALSAAQMGELEAAAELFGQAVMLEPTHAAAHANRGAVLAELGRWPGALESFERAIMLMADYAAAHCNRGNALKELGRPQDALASYGRAIEAQPDLAAAHSNRGNLLRCLGRWEEALAGLDRAIAVQPGLAEAHLNRGIVLKELNQPQAALASYDRAIAIKGDYPEAFCNRGIVLQELGRIDAALASFDRAIALRPDFAEARFNRSMALLMVGDFARGWSEYEWRWKTRPRAAADGGEGFRDRSPWLGTESLSGKTILLWCEQGLGDTLQFCRYAKPVSDLGARVILQVQRPLLGLLRGLEGVAQLLAPGDPLPAFDHHCPLLSLPLALRGYLPAIPAQVPYLAAGADKAEFWRVKLGPHSKRRVGLVWSGGFRADQPELWTVNSRRNIPLARLEPLGHADVQFFSLQKGEPARAELEDLPSKNWRGSPIIDLTEHLEDFADTAALIEQLDLIISVDTSTAHLAGALGKPVWILNRFDTCWRWLQERPDTHWYPTARLYRQARPGDWEDVIQRVSGDLARL